MFSAVRASRLLSRRIAVPRAPVLTSVRKLHVSRRVQAAGTPDKFLANIQDTPLFRQIADKPDIIKAILGVVTIIQNKGIDLTKGQSVMGMLNLMRDPEIQTALSALKQEVDKAGVKIDGKAVMDAISKIRQEGK